MRQFGETLPVDFVARSASLPGRHSSLLSWGHAASQAMPRNRTNCFCEPIDNPTECSGPPHLLGAVGFGRRGSGTSGLLMSPFPAGHFIPGNCANLWALFRALSAGRRGRSDQLHAAWLVASTIKRTSILRLSILAVRHPLVNQIAGAARRK